MKKRPGSLLERVIARAKEARGEARIYGDGSVLRSSRNRAAELSRAVKRAGGRGALHAQERFLSLKTSLHEKRAEFRSDCGHCKRLSRAIKKGKKELERRKRRLLSTAEGRERAAQMRALGIKV